MRKKERAKRIARALVKEIGSQSETARVVGVKQPSVYIWLRDGVSPTRENDLRFRFPKLKVWEKYPPLIEA